jgi:tetratricopeptide (TPR) repeat protein
MTFLDEFEVERALGDGGLGRVYLVRNTSTGQPLAVKRAVLSDTANRDKFLTELQNWINQPEHPHLVPCLFFREVGPEVFIFSEFVGGGSLADWVRRRKVTSLEQIFDIAIQMAWGLHAAHDGGVIHQDVKPSNVLLTNDGVARIADLGLARARLLGGAKAIRENRDHLVSTGGMTAAYCSPEQVEGERLTKRTDVWSWGVSVLEMFIGGATWTSGALALEVLKEYLAGGGRTPGLPAMPEPFVSILRRCFKWQPEDRWETLGATASAVASLYTRVLGKPYERAAPVRKGSGVVRRIAKASTTVTRSWADPRPWVAEALLADGKDLEEIDKLLVPPQATRREQATADLGGYENARLIFVRLVRSGRDELLPALACMHQDNAALLELTGDFTTALKLYDEVIKIYHHLVDRKGAVELTGELALAYEGLADIALRQRRYQDAADIYDQAIAIWEGLLQRDASVVYHGRLAAACGKKAEAIRHCGDPAEAQELCRRAIAGLRELKEEPVATHLAAARITAAHICHLLGDYAGALSAADKAMNICQPLLLRASKGKDARQHVAELLGTATPAQGPRSSLPPRARLRNCEQAIAMLERLVQAEGLSELAGDLARAHRGKELEWAAQEGQPPPGMLPEVCERLLQLLQQEGRDGIARRLVAAYASPAHAFAGKEPAAPFDRYVFHFERLVPRASETELHARQAEALLAKALACSGMGDDRQALPAGEQGLAVWSQLVQVEEHSERAPQLAAAAAIVARLLASARQEAKARSLYDLAITVYQELVQKEKRDDLASDLAAVKESRALLVEGSS